MLLGTFAVDSIRDRLRSITEEIEDWKHFNFPIDGAERNTAAEERGADVEHDEDDMDLDAEGEVDDGAGFDDDDDEV